MRIGVLSRGNRSSGRRLVALVVLAGVAAAGCGGNSSTPTSSANESAQNPAPAASQAVASNLVVAAGAAGVTPFIHSVALLGHGLTKLSSLDFTIAPKPAALSKPVHVHYTAAALLRKGALELDSPVGNGSGGTIDVIKLGVFGLYAGYVNQVSISAQFQDGSVANLPLAIEAAPYTDPNGIYDHPTFLKRRDPAMSLGFDYFVMKSGYGTPVILDTDGEIRWVGTGVKGSGASAVVGDTFLIGDAASASLFTVGFDGVVTTSRMPPGEILSFSHNIDPGKQGQIAEPDVQQNGLAILESVATEVTPAGGIVNQWDLGAILSAYMSSQGDDPTTFVRPGIDWFHMNATTYDPRDDSVIVSSRENFLIKLDYKTGAIIWIFGDPTKYWYTFPSLRAKALTLQPGGLYPIGQHAVSITPDGLVMVFNDGAASQHQPQGAPIGAARDYSAVSAYAIDPATSTVQEAWRFDYGQTILSLFCSSAYESSDGSVLVDYAVTEHFTQTRIVGLDPQHNVVFDFRYPTQLCNTGWNAIPIALDAFVVS